MSATRSEVARAVASLEPRERLLLVLTRVEGLDLSTAAAIAGTTATGAARLVADAIAKLERLKGPGARRRA